MKKQLLLCGLLTLLGFPVASLNAQMVSWHPISAPFVAHDLRDSTQVSLQSYLDSGKYVVIDYSAAWCNPCWQLHRSGLLEQLNALDNFQAIWIECDNTNTTAQITGTSTGSSYSGTTCGNWVDPFGNGTPVPFPMIDDDSAGTCYATCASLVDSYIPLLILIAPNGMACNLRGQYLYYNVTQSVQNIQSIASTYPQAGQNPQCYVKGVESVASGISTTFTALYNSFDSITSVTWSAPGATPSTSTGDTFSCTFSTVGTHTVTLSVANNNGTTTATHTVNVFALPDSILTYTYGQSYENGYGSDFGNTTRWAVSFPPHMLANIPAVASVDCYVRSTGTYTMTIYSGTDSMPQSLVGSVTLQVTSDMTYDFLRFNLPVPAEISANRTLWVVMESDAYEPAAACEYVGNPNSNWVSTYGTIWTHASGDYYSTYSWLITVNAAEAPILPSLTLLNPDGGRMEAFIPYTNVWYCFGDSTSIPYNADFRGSYITLTTYNPYNASNSTTPRCVDMMDSSAHCLTHLYIDGVEIPLGNSTPFPGGRLNVFPHASKDTTYYLYFTDTLHHTVLANYGPWRGDTSSGEITLTLQNPDGGSMFYSDEYNQVAGTTVVTVTNDILNTHPNRIHLTTCLPSNEYYVYWDTSVARLTQLVVDGIQISLDSSYSFDMGTLWVLHGNGYIIYELTLNLNTSHTVLARFGSWGDTLASNTATLSLYNPDGGSMQYNSDMVGDSLVLSTPSSTGHHIFLTSYFPGSPYIGAVYDSSAARLASLLVNGEEIPLDIDNYHLSFDNGFIEVINTGADYVEYHLFIDTSSTVVHNTVEARFGSWDSVQVHLLTLINVGDGDFMVGNYLGDRNWFYSVRDTMTRRVLGGSSIMPHLYSYYPGNPRVADGKAFLRLYVNDAEIPRSSFQIYNDTTMHYGLHLYGIHVNSDLTIRAHFGPSTQTHTITVINEGSGYITSYEKTTPITDTMLLSFVRGSSESIGMASFEQGSLFYGQYCDSTNARLRHFYVDDVEVSLDSIPVFYFAEYQYYWYVYHLSNITSDHTVRAVFGPWNYNFTVAATSSDTAMGTVTGGGVYADGATATLTAIPAPCHQFSGWGDGVADNPRSLTVNADTTITAIFAPIAAAAGDVAATACDSYTWNGQTYTASGTYTFATSTVAGCDSIATLSLTLNYSVADTLEATATESYDWNGQTYTESGTYTYSGTTVHGCDSTVTLLLTIEPPVVYYTVTVASSDDAMGSVLGGGTYEAGTEVTLTAMPAEGHEFVQWNDGPADNPRTFVLTSDTAFTAQFQPEVGIDDVDATTVTLHPNPATTTVTLTGLEPGAQVTIVDLNGREISKFKIQNSEFEIDVTSLASGAYYVRITGQRQNAIRKLIVK